MSILENIILSVATTFSGVLLALWIDRMRMPAIEILVTEKAHSDNTYPAGSFNAGQRWKFFRVSIANRRMPFLLKWLVRQTAENCRAILNITGIDNPTSISFKGRWASTPELPFLKDNAILRLFDPDPVTILSGGQEFLDVVTKYENDREAYGWNNESYVYNWRNPGHKLERGKYKVKITVNTQNGISATKIFFLIVGDTIENTYFTTKNKK